MVRVLSTDLEIWNRHQLMLSIPSHSKEVTPTFYVRRQQYRNDSVIRLILHSVNWEKWNAGCRDIVPDSLALEYI